MTCEALGKTGKDGETCSEDEEFVDGKLSNLSVVGVVGCSVVVATRVGDCEG